MTAVTPTSSFDVSISLENPSQDYDQLISDKVQSEDIVDDDVMRNNYLKIAAVAHKTIWKLLFESDAVTRDHQVKIAEFLRKIKQDACFHDPFTYNEWIIGVREELLKRHMLDFWRDHMVAKELGPCWARDSDYFDNMEDPAPAAFYKFGGCVAPFVYKTERENNTEGLSLAQSIDKDALTPSANFEAKISVDTPASDYENLMKNNVQSDKIVDDELISENFNKISTAARNTIWKLLFSQEPATEERKEKAGELLSKLKADACFFNPWSYNEWIGTVRDELLKREMLDFWRTQLVAKELGPCWARDSDFFDDMEDSKPWEFYNHGGCAAPFHKPE